MRLLEITLGCEAISEQRRFYTEALGIPEIEGMGGSDGLALQIGASRLTFMPGTPAMRYHFAFNIPHGTLQAAITWLKKCGVFVLEQPGKGHVVDFPNWKAQSVYFFDPADNIVELIAREPLPHKQVLHFGPDLLLNVSEIGAGFDDVDVMRNYIVSTHGLPTFIRQEQGSEFSVIGDDEGLLLLVPPTRNWFMGDFEAGKHPTSVKLEHGGRTVQLTWHAR